MDLLSEARRTILKVLKELGRATIPQLAERLGVSTEAVRQQLVQLDREGWVGDVCGRTDVPADSARALGRPPVEYCLTLAGDELFPKQYDDLAIALLDRAGKETLAAITDDRVERLTRDITDEMPLEKKLRRVQDVYSKGDPYITIERRPEGPRVIERNCPFLGVALERPAICSTTVSTLRRILGYEVVREERFQEEDGRCAFQVYLDRPLSSRARGRRFEMEPPRRSTTPSARK
ncbi:MAG TPA: winged helix-turn-helix transcriptional regulator [Thermoanaerobaculia bacterium]|nr:winged helix-turn-helix transcriptional regulator [Thermoanaerobaculia bacterium]